MGALRGDLTVIAVAAVAVLVFIVAIAVFPWPQQRASAPRETGFDAGFIISDARFYNPDTMSVAQVRRFLRSVPCVAGAGAVCLADYRQTTPDRPLSYAHCAAYTGKPDQDAAQIVVDVAQACRINPQVLLVLLQKEQSLLTHPTVYGYQRATGYGCPDTAPCDADFFGFFNQVYKAAWQFREYTVDPADFHYHVGENVIRYSAKRSCGFSTVEVQTQATADLYDYTPYQPSPQAVAGVDGECSSFGNLDFFTLYSRWFGSPREQPLPPEYAPCLNLVGGRRCAVDPTTGL